MNPEIKQKWVDALRSGNYHQGEGSLKDNDKFCCLGVLCDLYLKENGGEWDLSEKYAGRNIIFGSYALPPVLVWTWAGLDNENPCLNSGYHLTNLNDGLKFDFNRIANIIEEEL